MPEGSAIGRATPRIDGRLKVTGEARYAADVPIANLAHAFLVTSDIAKGRIAGFDFGAARRVPGLIEIFTHENMPGAVRPLASTGWPRFTACATSEPRDGTSRIFSAPTASATSYSPEAIASEALRTASIPVAQ